jgi:hypothetical protein
MYLKRWLFLYRIRSESPLDVLYGIRSMVPVQSNICTRSRSRSSWAIKHPAPDPRYFTSTQNT